MMCRRSSRSNSCFSNGHREFFKVYLPDQSSKQLKIPPAFVKHLKGPLPMVSILEGPTDKAWFVNLKKVDDNVVIEKGWEGFVEDNCLEFGDFLLFRYNGFSKFRVTLYGNNGCQKEIAATELQKRRSKRDEDLTRGNGAIRVKVEENRETPIESVLVVNGNVKPTRKRKRRTSGSRPVRVDQKAKPRKSQRLSCKDNETKQALRPTRSCVILPNDTAAKAAKKFKSKYPHFMVLVCESHVSRAAMTIPISFAQKYMKGDHSKVVKLRISNKAWNVILRVYLSQLYKLSTGWIAFARANHLREGDVCVFELTNTDNFVLQVSIFRN